MFASTSASYSRVRQRHVNVHVSVVFMFTSASCQRTRQRRVHVHVSVMFAFMSASCSRVRQRHVHVHVSVVFMFTSASCSHPRQRRAHVYVSVMFTYTSAVFYACACAASIYTRFVRALTQCVREIFRTAEVAVAQRNATARHTRRADDGGSGSRSSLASARTIQQRGSAQSSSRGREGGDGAQQHRHDVLLRSQVVVMETLPSARGAGLRLLCPNSTRSLTSKWHLQNGQCAP